jgi:hypothetical protein
MKEQRRQILDMLAAGKITADEAERLIEALQREQPETPPATTSHPKIRPKYIRVVLDADDGISGATRINVRVPLQLLRAGVRLTTLIPPAAITRVNAELERAGVPIDLAELKPQHLDDLIEHLDDVVVDVDDPGAKVRVYCE